MTIYIKNMVCIRCKMAVQTVLERLEIDYLAIELGYVKLTGKLNPAQHTRLSAALKHYELELMDNKKEVLVERIKNLITEIFHSENDDLPLKFTEYLSKNLHYEYTYLSNVFSEMEGITIERFFISNRIERVKELIIYEEMSIKEISYQLNYSSVSHLCLQFKKVTGITPSMFKKLCESDEYIWKSVNDILNHQNNITV
ncbi:MAG: AraC family transcriptional regulator [Chitinophagaceae bacterium]